MNSLSAASAKQVWQQLADEAKSELCLVKLFEENAERASEFQVEASGLYLDFSKQLISSSTFKNLLQLADECQLKDAIHRLKDGELVNCTEGRAALHMALRVPKSPNTQIGTEQINLEVHESLKQVESISERVCNRVWRGSTGKSITDVVNIGVGGSDLGPLMVVDALNHLAQDNAPNTHFISNMDGTQLSRLLRELSPETTLFIVSSKSFGTADTLSNAKTAVNWLLNTLGDKHQVMRNHVIGVSANPERMSEFGISKENQVLFWDWVGGRFSMWSAIGLPIAIRLGFKNFEALLKGANSMDQHFISAPFEKNLPVVLGLVGVWNSTFLGIRAHTVLPYDGRLSLFPDYLMQLEMESNGKSVDVSGTPIKYPTAPITWGDVGSNAQHAFYQLLHQGTQKVSSDFIAPIKRYEIKRELQDSLYDQHLMSLANCLAQSRVLAFGNAALEDQDAAQNGHKRYRGNQPSSTILLDRLSPETLGALVAAYEHKVFVMSVIWNINPFDQWGVEMGKVMAGKLSESIEKRVENGFDSSTNALLSRIIHAGK